MADEVRVALLARAGNARDQLHRALSDLGATLVAEGDPSELNPVAVAAQSPTLVIISVEPAIEAALDRFDGLLALPGVDVMYDDAEVTRQLDGWDLNRWARHLAAKLLGRDVLPPAPEGAAEVSRATTDPMSAPVHVVAEGASPATAKDLDPVLELADDMPLPSLGLDLDPDDLEQAIGRIDAGLSPSDATRAEASEAGFTLDVDLGGMDLVVDGGEEAKAGSRVSASDDSGLMLDIDFDSQPGGFARFGGGDDVPAAGLDDDVAALAAQLDALSAHDQREQPQEPEFARAVQAEDDPPKPAATRLSLGDEPAAERREAAPAAKPSFDFSGLSLAPMDDAAAVPAAAPAPAAPKAAASSPPPSLGGLGSGLSLEPMEDEQPASPIFAKSAASVVTPAVASLSEADIRGVVLILAGLGGPDAVRQLLKALPAQMPVAVLLYQHLEVGNHDRLVSQLAKVSAWPVYLAGAGMSAAPGQVAVMPQGVAPAADGEGVVFVPGSSQRAMIEGLPASGSMVFLLSGADADAVPAALALASKGGAAMAQDPAACFDPAAAQALVAGGARAGDAASMAALLVSRWA